MIIIIKLLESLELMESVVRSIGAAAGLVTLAIAIIAMLISLRRPAGREEKGARFALSPPVLILATFLFFGAGVLLWRPMPCNPSILSRVVFLSAGLILYFGGLALYLWGMFSLGHMFAPSSGFGVRLHAQHKLVTRGSYAIIRHPMYAAVIAASIGSCLLYRTWSTFALVVIMFGLVVRAHREEKILSEEFGREWKNYASRVPAWFPGIHFKRKNKVNF